MRRFALAISLLCTTAASTVIINPMPAHAGEIYNREVREQGQINRGVQNGKISGAEYRNLERREVSINRERERDLRSNDGHLTSGERRELNRRENNLNRSIHYDERHNDRH